MQLTYVKKYKELLEIFNEIHSFGKALQNNCFSIKTKTI